MYEFNKEIILTPNERKMLLYSVNYYIEKIEFNLRNADTMFLSGLGKTIFEKDLETLISLRTKLFSLEVIAEEPDILVLNSGEE